ncbi:class I SAM-dependent methyltransferase [Bacillus cereus]|uniref:class I SAM-dependent methyltransferase n=1 Tax=Bacillus cereus TaxID=1396 RepID=UPI00019FE332|nr:class I SAM-dependent methyltransferase [Bacillus cereus]EEK63400.1 Methyltransferase [Bacillus cereus 172560W]WPA86214.1 class I SAM-dependent methyltransferase [Bacillus cereus]
MIDIKKQTILDYFDAKSYITTYNVLYDNKTEDQLNFIKKVFLGGKSNLRILDFCCGHGRHLIPLFLEGYNIDGLDFNIEFLDKIQNQIGSVNVHFADGRCFQTTNKYDAIINMENSIGYFSEKEDREILTSIYNNLKSSGVFLLHLLNRELLIKYFEEEFEFLDSNGDKVREIRSMDMQSSRVHLQQYRNCSPNSPFETSLRVYTAAEIINTLQEIGFKINNVYGDFHGREYTLTSPELIIICSKETIK